MTLSVLEPSISFSVICDCMICDCDICDHPMINIIFLSCFVTCMIVIYDITSHPSSKFKIKINSKENK